MRGTYKNTDNLPQEGDIVHKHHLWDGTHNAGKVLPATYTIKKLHSVDPQINACCDRSYAELNDGSYEYTWNLSKDDGKGQ